MKFAYNKYFHVEKTSVAHTMTKTLFIVVALAKSLTQ